MGPFRASRLIGLWLLLAALGCRTMPPELKPPPEAEVLNVPPQEARFETSIYPREAFANARYDPTKKSDNAVMPAKGMGMGPPGMAGPGR